MRPVANRRLIVEGTAWKFRTGAPWRDLPAHFGNWNSVLKNFDRWAKDGTWTKVLEHVQTRAETLGDLDWVASIDSRIVRLRQHGATLPRLTGGPVKLQKLGIELPDHAIGRSRGGLTSKGHMATHGKGQKLSAVLTAGNLNDTTIGHRSRGDSGPMSWKGNTAHPLGTAFWQIRATRVLVILSPSTPAVRFVAQSASQSTMISFSTATATDADAQTLGEVGLERLANSLQAHGAPSSHAHTVTRLPLLLTNPWRH
ncbi:IS5 family transposase [Arthrobacter sp. B6]|uniref:IS5 family transposase n=1 Tax=Arthrobacter sp. B6 TaxID=1570137 RepID=UPI000834025B